MFKKSYFLIFLVGFLLFANSCNSNLRQTQSSLLTIQATNIQNAQKNDLESALKDLKPRKGNSGLLLAFDTDTGQDRQSYTQFYDSNKEFIEKNATNKTLFFTRKDSKKIYLSANLNFVASPQKNDFLYLGQTRYFEPKPRDKNDHLDRLEKESSTGFKNFGFDYTRIWQTKEKSQIPKVKRELRKRIKEQIDAEYKKLKLEDREYHRNITDYRKISFISEGFYITRGFFSLIHGGAAWFEGREKSEVTSLNQKRLSHKLKDHFPKSFIESGFRKTKERHGDRRFNHNEKIGYFENSTFDFARYGAETHLLGLITVDGNAHRSFFAEADFGKAPEKFIKYDNSKIDFGKFKKIYPSAIDVFVSPNQNTVIVLTDKKIIGIDVEDKKEIYNKNHHLKFNKVIMVEWAIDEYVEKWEDDLNKN